MSSQIETKNTSLRLRLAFVTILATAACCPPPQPTTQVTETITQDTETRCEESPTKTTLKVGQWYTLSNLETSETANIQMWNIVTVVKGVVISNYRILVQYKERRTKSSPFHLDAEVIVHGLYGDTTVSSKDPDTGDETVFGTLSPRRFKIPGSDADFCPSPGWTISPTTPAR